METILGLDIEKTAYEKTDRLPLYITANNDIKRASIGGCDCILLRPLESMGTVESIMKQIHKIGDISGLPVAIELPSISGFRRKSFLKNRVPFLTERQVYLPFIGTYLEHCSEAEYKTDKLTASAQVALIRWLYDPKDVIRVTELMKDLGYTAMTISRAAKQLKDTGCFDLVKEGNANVLKAKFGAEETFNRLNNQMISPVEVAGYVDLPTEWELTVAGTEAVSERTMLGALPIHEYAAYKVNRKKLRNELIDSKTQAYVEIWKYDPKILRWKDGCADPISVALSLRDNHDERVEAAVEDMLSEVWR